MYALANKMYALANKMYAQMNKMYAFAIILVFNLINFITKDYDISVVFMKKTYDPITFQKV